MLYMLIKMELNLLKVQSTSLGTLGKSSLKLRAIFSNSKLVSPQDVSRKVICSLDVPEEVWLS